MLVVPLIILIPLAGWFLWLRECQAKRAKLLVSPFPDAWVEILSRNLPPYASLSDEERFRLHGTVNVFLAEKRFEGCGELEITDEMRVTIAGQACLLLLNRVAPVYPKLRTILVYPNIYVAGGKSRLGNEEQKSVRLGESWGSGVVVLSWNSVRSGAANFDDGQNVTLHEFAHQLDQADGVADGAPILDDRSAYRTWALILSKEYAVLRGRASKGRRTVLNKYGATNPAEFFAVATETFFEKPQQMHKKHQELYEVLRDYYHTDPLTWE